MRTPTDVLRFMKDMQVLSWYTIPTVGIRRGPAVAFGGTANGRSVAWYDSGTVGAKLHLSYFHNITPVAEDHVVIAMDYGFPGVALELKNAETPEEITFWREARAGIGDIDYGLIPERTEEAVKTLKKPPEPKLTTQTMFVRWFYSPLNSDLVPAGVFGIKPGAGMIGAAVPAFEDRHGAILEAYKDAKEGSLGELAERIGRNSFVSGPEYIRGEDYQDAMERGLHKMAAEYYQKTGRSAF